MNEDKIIQKLLEQDDKLASIVTKEEFQQTRNEILSGQDTMITILKRLDEERIFANKWIKDIETKVARQEEEIRKIKLQLNLV
ncbi:MAG: hypothetical protein A2754_00980 [Candidatus Magasanikbacteria bacterium RIFCSPHIGHO2_01_FULL_47_8]|uniref:Uncharacterized protein n=1 Tax=Candidatus Magasanikbacteria bacterium RIFCSPHIGHO2_01_FULL_47_8 TaxID=1798673 RepID=A0A1F6MBM6_9BACT|nr:MAG: hypothetical protein A2754_00980 [Candidatus Magasanikbacteria bacterium RIFCSPHIGHO2_01_FULL_47_8]